MVDSPWQFNPFDGGKEKVYHPFPENAFLHNAQVKRYYTAMRQVRV